MTRRSTNHILDLIEEGSLDAKSFLQSLLQAMSEAEVTDNLEYIQRVEDWPKDMQLDLE